MHLHYNNVILLWQCNMVMHKCYIMVMHLHYNNVITLHYGNAITLHCGNVIMLDYITILYHSYIMVHLIPGNKWVIHGNISFNKEYYEWSEVWKNIYSWQMKIFLIVTSQLIGISIVYRCTCVRHFKSNDLHKEKEICLANTII